MSSDSQYFNLGEENLKSGEETMEFTTTDDECTGQRARRHTKNKLEEVDINIQKIISKQKSESMFELRKLSHQQHPVSAFNKKSAFEDFLSRKHPSQSDPIVAATKLAPTAGLGEDENLSPSMLHPKPVTKGSSQSPSPGPEPMAHPSDVQEPAGNVSDRVQQFNPPAEPTPQSLMPDEIRLDMQNLMERQIVHEVLQGPAEEIDRALREGMEDGRARRRPRPRPRPRPRASQEEDGDDGGDEMGQANVRPVGRLLSRSNRRGRSHNRHVQFAPALPVPNADGRYPVPRRDQSIIVDRLRQSPALNSLGEEARDEIVAEVSGLVSQQLVTSALSGEFRGVLELHVQSRAQQMQIGQPRPVFVIPPRRLEDDDFDDREALPSAHIRELREEMMSMRGQLNELKQMMKLSFDLQLDIQRSIRQEVAAALSSALSQQSQHEDRATRSYGSEAGAAGYGSARVVDSGRCVICSEGTIDSVIYHCGHMATCIACGLEMKSKALKCPICRAPIIDVIRAYTSMQ